MRKRHDFTSFQFILTKHHVEHICVTVLTTEYNMAWGVGILSLTR
jgi:hypothetical protein